MDSSGAIARRFWVGLSERPFQPEGRHWVAEMLPRFIRQTGIGAASRVARSSRQGPARVLAEISLIEGSWAKRRLLHGAAEGREPRRLGAGGVLSQAGREIDSDFELASLYFIASADQLIADDATRKAYLDAARSISSDFELRRVLSSALKRASPTIRGCSRACSTPATIDSDFEEASLLIDVAKLESLDGAARGASSRRSGPWRATSSTAASSARSAKRRNLSDDTVRAMLESSSRSAPTSNRRAPH